MAVQTVKRTTDYPSLPSFEAILPVVPNGTEFYRQDSYYQDRYWKFLKEDDSWVRLGCNPAPI